MSIISHLRLIRCTAAACSAALLISCMQTYRIDVQQGNHFEDATLKQVKVGMTKKQVRFLLGTALVKDPFHVDRWDYFYSLSSPEKNISERHRASFLFVNDRVTEIIRDQLPSDTVPPEKTDRRGFFGNLLNKVNPFD